MEAQVKAELQNVALGQSLSRAFLVQPPWCDLGQLEERSPRLAGSGSPACPFNPAAGREHVSGTPGGTRAPPPPRQLYFERGLWPAASRLGSAVRLASLLLILFLLHSPLPFIRPRLEVGTLSRHPLRRRAYIHPTRILGQELRKLSAPAARAWCRKKKPAAGPSPTL